MFPFGTGKADTRWLFFCLSPERRIGPPVAAVSKEGSAMSDDFVVLLPEEPSTAAKVADGIKTATGAMSDAIDAGREPGMPLDTLARAVREAPLAALAVAFLVGYAFAKPRR